MWASLVVYFFTPVLLGTWGVAKAYGSGRTWYHSLNKPRWAFPPRFLLPVYGLWFTLMGIAAARVVSEREESPDMFNKQNARIALQLFWLQFLLSLVTCTVFFHVRAIVPSLLSAALLWIFVFLTMAYFFQVDTVAGWLIMPYTGWTAFQLLTTYYIWELQGVDAENEGTRFYTFEPVPSHLDTDSSE